MASESMKPSEMVQMAYVARRFYNGGATMVQIAEELGISRFKAARILTEAKEIGLVTITVNSPGGLSKELSDGLVERYGLTNAFAVTTVNNAPATVRSALGRAAGSFLARTVTREDVLGMASGRTLNVIVDHLRSMVPCETVQLTGMAGELHETSSDLIRRVCEVSGGKAFPIYAPLIASDAQAAAAFRRQPSVKSAFDRFSKVTKAVVAVGSWDPPESQLSDALSQEERAELLALGVKAEVAAGLLTSNGEQVHALEDRALAITLGELREIPEVIAVAGSEYKVDAISAVLKASIITSLVTDAATAEKLLDS